MTDFLMVDVASVISNVPRSNFKEADLDNLADMILKSEGILRPLVLKKIGFEKYAVIDGHFEYYASVRAREKNPSEGEMVNSLIVSPNKEEVVLKQANFLKKIEYGDNLPEIVNQPIKTDVIPTQSSEISLIEKQINDLRVELAQERQERQKLYEYIKSLETQIPKQITPLEAFNSLNLLELTLRLRTAGFTDKKAAQVAESVEKARKKKQFESLKDVIARVTIASAKKQVKGISADKMVDIVDIWSHILFK
ncbi:chromosome partitioning protein ParB [Nostoc sp. LEGE 06077]|uniref:ParB N-terminal domain-containing protein n=1 Tax=Nostoc sp. LEGE 06077 TaxID=915325 RepID=UPI0018802BAE|nr:chromosome partitioning protein ParB [Nostoc sp. LEGE 06077]MBE9209263.1 chromosome partitioning protein ParB [Nostoc sp. LEGE 06077]